MAGFAGISATPDGNAVVPVGFETLYVLTQGAGLLIVDAGATPAFTVTTADDYTIYTLVYDPTTLDPGTDIQIGSTTGFDVNTMLIQGGGSICGSLDVAGAYHGGRMYDLGASPCSRICFSIRGRSSIR